MIALLKEHKKARPLDIALARQLLDIDEHAPVGDEFYFILLLLYANAQQHTCLDLNHVDWQNPFALPPSVGECQVFSAGFDVQQVLANLPCVGVGKPIRVYGQRVYLARYDDYEQQLAERFSTLAKSPIVYDATELTRLLDVYFGHQDGEVDWQKVACAVAATRKFSVITGGPGTGKTTTVTRLLAIIQSMYESSPLHIELVAPTGKAAARLSESIRGAKAALEHTSQHVMETIPDTAQTIHRLLGTLPYSNQFRHNRVNPVHADLVVVDEASMIDIGLMSKLVDALPAHTRLILLGDKDQLSSVDTGNIMADLCQQCQLGRDPFYSDERINELSTLCSTPLRSAANSAYALKDEIAFLQKSYRFDGKQAIGQLAKAINEAKPEVGFEVLTAGDKQVSYFPHNEQFYSQTIARAVDNYSAYLQQMQGGASPAQVHEAFAQFQLLCAQREGPFGINELNARIERGLTEKGLIDARQAFYAGMPIMINQNDYQLQLFNGDVGILLADESGQLKAYFMAQNEQVRAFAPTRLPQFDKAYAMTIHKSQGSEFAHVAILLPGINRAKMMLNRQLLYTGVTRAKQHLELVCDKAAFFHACNTPLTRLSGLYDRLSNG